MTLEIPILDFSKYCPDDPFASASNELFLAELRDVMQRVGFFYIKNHGVAETLQKEALDVAKRFFALPIEEKLKIEIKNSPHFRGYSRLGSETTDGAQDFREQIDLARESQPSMEVGGNGSNRVPYYHSLHGLNQWPAVPAEFHRTIEEFQKQVTRVALKMLQAMARSLEVIDYDEFMSWFGGDDYGVRMKIVHYPPGSKDANGWGVGPHKDYGFLTVLLQDDIGGLEVQTHQGEWKEAAPVPNTFVINIGQTFERLTNKAFISTTHRVRVNHTHHRYSIPLFLAPSLDAQIPQVAMSFTEKNEVTDVRQDQLLQNEIYGVNEMNGFLRSHKEVAAKWYAFDEATQTWHRRRPAPGA
ncbi:hypothetical protein BX666DRAFT_1039177 [Dichotomocladium elegans]|nr:hypothetical protein BX666DRAFT_1039177 [Dichotomocladium elegans]